MAGIGGERTRFIHQLWFFGFLPSLSAARPRVQHTVPFRNPEQLSLVGPDTAGMAAEHRRTGHGAVRVSVHGKFAMPRKMSSRRDLRVAMLREFAGKFVAATNRDLASEIGRGNFREDLYYRLCADIVRTPTLKEQLMDRPEDLLELTRFIARELLVELPDEAESLASETVHWVEKHFGNSYDWPGNIRELEQCVRNVMIRKSYTPSSRISSPISNIVPDRSTLGVDAFVQSLLAGEMTLDEVSELYVTMVYAQLGQYDLVGKKLGLDWRTVKDKVKLELLSKLK